jgi:hypothetical protein
MLFDFRFAGNTFKAFRFFATFQDDRRRDNSYAVSFVLLGRVHVDPSHLVSFGLKFSPHWIHPLTRATPVGFVRSDFRLRRKEAEEN